MKPFYVKARKMMLVFGIAAFVVIAFVNLLVTISLVHLFSSSSSSSSFSKGSPLLQKMMQRSSGKLDGEDEDLSSSLQYKQVNTDNTNALLKSTHAAVSDRLEMGQIRVKTLSPDSQNGSLEMDEIRTQSLIQNMHHEETDGSGSTRDAITKPSLAATAVLSPDDQIISRDDHEKVTLTKISRKKPITMIPYPISQKPQDQEYYQQLQKQQNQEERRDQELQNLEWRIPKQQNQDGHEELQHSGNYKQTNQNHEPRRNLKKTDQQSLEKGAKYLIYECPEGRQCGGMADRFNGIVLGYLLAQVTGRQFRISMPLPGCRLSDFLQENTMPWDVNITQLLGTGLKKTETAYERINAINLLTEELSTSNYNERFGDSDIVHFRSNLKRLKSFLANPHHASALAGWRQLRTSDIYRKIIDDLFKLALPLQMEVDAALAKGTNPGGRPPLLVCAQIRMGSNPSIPTDTAVRVTPHHLTIIWDFMKKIKKLKEEEQLHLQSQQQQNYNHHHQQQQQQQKQNEQRQKLLIGEEAYRKSPRRHFSQIKEEHEPLFIQGENDGNVIISNSSSGSSKHQAYNDTMVFRSSVKGKRVLDPNKQQPQPLKYSISDNPNFEQKQTAHGATDPRQYFFFVSSDSQQVTEEASKQLGHQLLVVESAGKIVHVDKPLAPDDICPGMRRVVVDMYVLRSCDVLLLTKSGVGDMAAYLRGKEEGLYCLRLDSGVIDHCSI